MNLINHVVAGSAGALINALETLATDQMSAMQIFELVEQLGHIEVTRTISGKPDQWALVMKQVLFRDSPTSALLGLWQSVDFEEANGFFEPLIEVKWPRVGLEFETPDDVDDVSEKLVALGFDCGSPKDVIDALPGLAWVRENLTRLPLPSTESIEIFDFEHGRWVESDHLLSGAVRLRGGYGARYFYLSHEDLNGGVGVSSSSTVVKYLAANERDLSLLKYSKNESTLFAPLGAKIPGLYGRAVLLASGTAPEEVEISYQGKTIRMIQYKNVPLNVAKTVSSLLKN
jgi:hypothetical protein